MQRNTTVDLARALASYGVIALHIPCSTRGAELIDVFFWPLCVPFFYTVSLVYFIAGLRKATVGTVLIKTWYRIGLPYLAWSVVYAGLLITKNTLVHSSEPQKFIVHSPVTFDFWRIWLYGESGVQLYFLPTLLMLQAMALSLYLLFKAREKQRLFGLLLLLVSCIYLGIGIYNHCFGMSELGMVVSVAMYLLAGFGLAPKMNDAQTKPFYIAIGLLLMVFAIECNSLGNKLLLLGTPMILPVGGIGLLLVTIGFPRFYLPKWLAQLAAVSFGIYLCHILFLEAFEFMAARVYTGEIMYNFLIKLVEAVLLFILSAGLVLLLKRVAFLRQVFLGEGMSDESVQTSKLAVRTR